MEIFRLISSGSQSVVVVPSSTLPRRVTAPAATRSVSTRDVLPALPCPTTATLRILPISIVIHRLLRVPMRYRASCTGGLSRTRRQLPQCLDDGLDDVRFRAREVHWRRERRRCVLD